MPGDPAFNPYVVRRILAKRGITLRAFAKEVGVDKGTVNSWMSGYIRNPKPANLRRVIEFLGLTSREEPEGWVLRPPPPLRGGGQRKKEAATGVAPVAAREDASDFAPAKR